MEAPYRSLIVELRSLQAEFHELDMYRREMPDYGDRAPVASAYFARRAREGAERAVLLFEQAARILDEVEGNSYVVSHIRGASEHLAALFRDDTATVAMISLAAAGEQWTKPTLLSLLYGADGKSAFHAGASLHDHVLFAADEARRKLQACKGL